MMVATLSSIAACQFQETKDALADCHQLFHYSATHPNATIRCLASDIILAVHSDVTYISDSKSRAPGHSHLTKVHDENFNNGVTLTLSTVIKHAVALTSEAELDALLYNCKHEIPL